MGLITRYIVLRSEYAYNINSIKNNLIYTVYVNSLCRVLPDFKLV